MATMTQERPRRPKPATHADSFPLTVTHKKQFKLTRKPLSGSYTLKPQGKTDDQGYRLDVMPRVNASMPFMILYESSKHAVASVRRPVHSATFDIGLGGGGDFGGDGDDVAWQPMQRTGSKEASWTAAAPTGETRELMWKGTTSIAVDEMRPSKLSGGGFKLVDMVGPNNVVAVFTPKRGVSSCGVLQINVDWGTGFEQMVIMTFMCLYDRVSTQATNAVGHGTTGNAGGFGAVG